MIHNAPTHTDDTRRIWLIIAGFLLVRLALSAVFPLSIDEAYAVVVSRLPTLSYFDHPLLGFDFARASIWLFGSEAKFVARLPHVLAGSLAAFLLWRITLHIYGSAAAFWAIVWFSVAPFFFLSAGHFIVPDGPLNLFLLLTVWLLLPLFGDQASERALLRWLAAGVTLGLALLSKYQAVLFAAAAFLFLISTISGRKQLATPGPWLAAIIALAFLSPLVVWNTQHDWASFAFQSARAGEGFAFQPVNFFLMQLGQIGYLLPGTWAAGLWFLWHGLRNRNEPRIVLLACVAALPIIVFDAIALVSTRNLPHWPMSGFLFAFPFVGWASAQLAPSFPRFFAWSMRASIIGIPLAAFLAAAQANWAMFTRPFLERTPTGDMNWPIVSWDGLAPEFAARGIDLVTKGYLVPRSWSDGAKSAYALGPGVPVAEPLYDPRHFAFMSDERLSGRTTGYVITPATFGTEDDVLKTVSELASKRYNPSDDSWTVTQTRAGFPTFVIIVIPVTQRP
jgi:hypothetical protein